MLSLLLIAAVYTQSCTSPSTRPAWRTTMESQRQAYFAAIKALKTRPAGDFSGDMAHWNYDQFVKCHWDNVKVAHSVPAFLPWHRVFTNGYEKALQSIDPSINLPYWDWTLDSQNPTKADIFTSSYIGGTGTGSDNCVTDGVAANWQVTYPTAPSRPGSPCLKRCSNFTVLYSPEAMASTLNAAKTFDKLRSGIELGGHGAVHQQVGGSCGNLV
jgi:Common central domain of tyrosinase